MVPRDEVARMELAFDRENTASQREKVKAFWQFLNAEGSLNPQKGTPERKSPPETKSSSAEEEEEEGENIWRKGLEIFRRLGLDKTALAADNRRRLCLVDRATRCEDLADAVAQPYEELNADIEAFERRVRESTSNEIDGGAARRGSDYARTKR